MGEYSDLQGKVVIVTGGSGDLGEVISVEMARQRCKVYLTYKNSQERADEIVKKVEGAGGIAKAVACDVTIKHQVEEAVGAVISEEQRIDVLINNAGIYKDNLFSFMRDDEFESVMRTNVFGTYFFAKAVSKQMVKQKSGVIINISSLSGLTPAFGQANYSASKGAIVSLSRVMAAELMHSGIRVNTVAPGSFDTTMTKRVPKNIMQQIISMTASQRLGKPYELANVISFLSSEASSFIVGQTVIVDGGLFMR